MTRCGARHLGSASRRRVQRRDRRRGAGRLRPTRRPRPAPEDRRIPSRRRNPRGAGAHTCRPGCRWRATVPRSRLRGLLGADLCEALEQLQSRRGRLLRMELRPEHVVRVRTRPRSRLRNHTSPRRCAAPPHLRGPARRSGRSSTSGSRRPRAGASLRPPRCCTRFHCICGRRSVAPSRAHRALQDAQAWDVGVFLRALEEQL